MDDKPKTPLGIAGHKLWERLNGHFWVDGGFLTCIGIAESPDAPTIHVMLSRKLMFHERHLVPAEVDGFPVITKVVGKITVRG